MEGARRAAITIRYAYAAAAAVLLAGSIVGCSWKDGLAQLKVLPERAADDDRAAVTVVAPNNNRKFPAGMDENNNPYVRFIGSGTGLRLNWIVPSQDGYQDKLNVMMASDVRPDMIYSARADWVVDLANKKEIQPLNEAIAKYGSNLTKWIPQDAWDGVTIDGKIYAVPKVTDTQVTNLVFARKDWLDRLGLKPPRTIDEYTAVMRAFAERDPDGNGIRDTVGLIIGEDMKYSTPFFGTFGIQRRQWIERQGKLVYSGIQPEMKKALQFWVGLYKEGLLDPEFALNKEQVFRQKIVAGKAGMYAGYYHETRTSIKDSMALNPNAEWITLDFPTGDDGSFGIEAGPRNVGYNIVPSSSGKVNEVIRMLDFIVGDGWKPIKYGFENEVYRMQNGHMIINDEESIRSVYRLSLAFADQDNQAMLQIHREALGYNLVQNVAKGEKALRGSAFTGAPTPALVAYGDRLRKLEDDAFIRMIMGIIPIEQFEQYVDEWRQAGGDEMTEEVNRWYAGRKK